MPESTEGVSESIYFYEDLDYQLRAGSYIKHISVNDCIGYLYREGSQTHCKFTNKTMSCFSIIKKMENNDVSLPRFNIKDGKQYMINFF